MLHIKILCCSLGYVTGIPSFWYRVLLVGGGPTRSKVGLLVLHFFQGNFLLSQFKYPHFADTLSLKNRKLKLTIPLQYFGLVPSHFEGRYF